MTTFALIHGAWGSGWHWGDVPSQLRGMGHEAVAPDLPCEDPGPTFDDYAGVVLAALEDVEGDDVVVVGYSLGGHTAPLVASRRPVRALVYLAALLPEPGLSFDDQFARGDRMLLPDYRAGIEGTAGASRWVDLDVYRATSCHDCAAPVAQARFERSRGQSNRPYGRPCSLTAHPNVPTSYVLCTEDRLMNNAFWRVAVPERLGVEPIELGAAHTPMSSHPAELAALLVAS
ncbi:MAG TPA: alpha/beta hydrolase [Solirubrobacteraceae bacterium]|nr:alpha/beta hydrolase [Solirubrobacteraceae bacterium]